MTTLSCSTRLETRTKESHRCSTFVFDKRTSAMEVNAHVHLQSTVILRMASLQSTPHFLFLQHVQHFDQLPFFLTVFPNEVVFTG